MPLSPETLGIKVVNPVCPETPCSATVKAQEALAASAAPLQVSDAKVAVTKVEGMLKPGSIPILVTPCVTVDANVTVYETFVVPDEVTVAELVLGTMVKTALSSPTVILCVVCN